MNKSKNIGKGKQGQIQLGETVAVVIIVIIILVIGIVFWNKVSNSNLKDLQAQSQELSVIEIANTVPELPEIKCSESGVSKVKCLDWHKIRAMSQANDLSAVSARDQTVAPDNTVDNKIFNYYNSYFKDTRITIMPLYPEDDIISLEDIQDSEYDTKGKIWNVTLYDAKSQGKSVTKMIYIPVNIRDYVTKKTYYGLIIVEGYYNELQ